MNIKKILTVSLASTMTVGVLSALADVTGDNITQSQFESGLKNQLWSFYWEASGLMHFSTDGESTDNGGAFIQNFASTVSTWNILVTFDGNGNVTTSGTTDYLGGLINFSYDSPINSLAPIDHLMIGDRYQGNNDEMVSIGSILINGTLPVAGTVQASQDYPFEALMINYSGGAIGSLSYTMTVSTKDVWESGNSVSGAPSLWTTIAVPSAVPEPSIITLVGIGGLTAAATLYRRRSGRQQR